MTNLSSIRRAISAEVTTIQRELKRLQTLLVLLDGPSAPSASPITSKKRGRKSAAEMAAASEAGLARAIELIEGAGKGGIKALRLASVMKKEGLGKVLKAELVGSGRVRVKGKLGGTTYVAK